MTGDFHRDGYRLATSGEDNSIRIWDLRRKVAITTIPAHNKLVSDIQFQRDYSRFLISSSYDGSVKIWNTHDFSMKTKIEIHNSRVSSANVSKDLQKIFTTTMERKWHIFKRGESDNMQMETKIEGEVNGDHMLEE